MSRHVGQRVRGQNVGKIYILNKEQSKCDSRFLYSGKGKHVQKGLSGCQNHKSDKNRCTKRRKRPKDDQKGRILRITNLFTEWKKATVNNGLTPSPENLNDNNTSDRLAKGKVTVFSTVYHICHTKPTLSCCPIKTWKIWTWSFGWCL